MLLDHKTTCVQYTKEPDLYSGHSYHWHILQAHKRENDESSDAEIEGFDYLYFLKTHGANDLFAVRPSGHRLLHTQDFRLRAGSDLPSLFWLVVLE